MSLPMACCGTSYSVCIMYNVRHRTVCCVARCDVTLLLYTVDCQLVTSSCDIPADLLNERAAIEFQRRREGGREDSVRCDTHNSMLRVPCRPIIALYDAMASTPNSLHVISINGYIHASIHPCNITIIMLVNSEHMHQFNDKDNKCSSISSTHVNNSQYS